VPDSPIAIAGLLEEYEPVADQMDDIAEAATALLRYEPATPRVAGPERPPLHEAFGWLAIDEERDVLSRLSQRAQRLRQVLRDAEQSLRQMGWQLRSGGRLKALPGRAGGRAGEYVNRVIRDLYRYLRPIYERAFDDHQANPAPLREHVRRLLSPYLDPAALGTGRKGRIWVQFDRAAHREG
jgi:hypothetical protein